MAMRFVPLATEAGNPSIINTEREIILPPPARVFIKPTKTPAVMSMVISTTFIGEKNNSD
jgi:hypothetical protein